MKHSYKTMSWKRCVHRKLHQLSLYLLFQVLLVPMTFAQVDTGGNATTANHSKQIIGYITQWDAWKAANAGLPSAGALTHMNIDYSKYTILNYSFFGVAQDGSLHSGDHRNKNIYQSGAVQAPADILFTDIYSSWDFHILFGELDPIQHVNEAAKLRAESYGYVVELGGNTWSHPAWGLSGALPIPVPKDGGAPGILEMAHQNGVKVMASIGGWSMCKHFPEMAADPVKRATFIADCQKLINMGFDGIDLDWEYPGPYSGMNFTGTTADYNNFKILVEEIRVAIGPDKLITAAFSAAVPKLQGFDWAGLANTMDYFNMMSYDYNGGWSNKAGHNSPLYTYDNAEAPQANWHDTLNGLVAMGVPAAKINMGSAFYGRGVITNGIASLNAATVKRNENVQPDGPISTCADFTNWPKDVYDGTPNYFFIKQQALGVNSGWTEHWDDQAKVPYLTKDNFFLSYDNEQSIGLKAQYVKDNNLAGTIVWTVYGDLEFSGTAQSFGTKLKRWSNVNSELVNKINEVFADGGTPLNQPPTATLTAPQDGTFFQVGESITLEAGASDTDGTVTKVEFFEGTTKLGEDTSSPYSFTWNNAAVGNYALTAKAIDNEAASGTSSAIAISVSDGTGIDPQVSISSPSGGDELTTGTLAILTANASDSDGTIASVVFSVEGQSYVATLSGGNYSANWTPSANGSHTILATATDNDGLTGTDQVTVTSSTPSTCSAPTWDAGTVYNGGDQVSHNGILYQANYWTQNNDPSTHNGQYAHWLDLGPCGDPQNQAPTVSITSPVNNSSFNEGNVVIDASASDSDGTVTLVEFYVDGTKVGDDNSAPYSFSQSFLAGSYALSAVATDDLGEAATSATVNVTVTAIGSNVPPTVGITAPADGASYMVGDIVSIAATAGDSDGTVSKVEFFVGATKVGEDLSSPYSLDWTSTEGNFALTAVATDNESASTTSSPVNITVVADGGGDCTAPQYLENGGYAAGSEVQNDGKKYQCKDYPFSGWCDGSAWAYEPGVGAHWQDAWNDLGDCGGTNPPGNQLPIVSISAPVNGTNYTTGATVNISASASDVDGSVSKVEFFVNGTKIGEDLSSPYSISWASTDGNHQLLAKATDNENASVDSAPVNITVGTVTPPTRDLPDRVLVGYWHNFINGAGALKLSEISDKWDVINISFAEPSTQLGSTMAFVPDNAIYPTVQEFKNDVAALQSQGKKVLISLGGANGAIHLTTAADAQAYSSSMINIITEYGFDGLDIDLEGSSLSLDAGDTDFRNPTSPKIVNFINGTQTILNHFGAGFILTTAPETLYVQGALNSYGGGAGAYLPVIYAFKDRLNYIHVQHYNTGCMLGLGQNSPCYQQGTADFQVAMAEMLLQGFPVPGHTTGFPALRQDQVAIGLPASPQAAGGGYTTPATVHQALDYLVKGISYGGNYTLVNSGGYPNFRGLMTWSINWDEFYSFEFSNNHRTYLDALGAASSRTLDEGLDNKGNTVKTDQMLFYPNPFTSEVKLTFSLLDEKKITMSVYNQIGAKVADLINDQSFELGSHTVTWDSNQMPKGLYLVRLRMGDDVKTYRIVKQ